MIPQFITFDDIDRLKGDLNESTLLAKAANVTGKTVFLSHSSDDHKYLPTIISILSNHGASVYVDDADPTVKGDDFVEVANRLRTAVNSCRKFVLFVTENTKGSLWIPWELGLGDGTKGEKSVALFPAAKTAYSHGWSQQEYLGLYDRIVWNKFEGKKEPEWMILNFRKNTGLSLSSWLSQ